MSRARAKKKISKTNQAKETKFSRDDFDVLDEQNIKRISPTSPDVEPDEKLDINDDLEIVSIFRKLVVNNSQVKGWLGQIFLNTICTGQKPIFNSSNTEWNKKAKEYYRKKSKKWEGRDNKNRYRCNELTFKTSYIEGEIFAYYDAAGIIEPGKWFYWTREYMTMINKVDFKNRINKIRKIVGAKTSDVLKQVKGLITNQWGVTKGYIICSKPGLGESRYLEDSAKNKITIIPANRNAKLIKFSEEINAKHGLSMMIALAEEVNDVKRLLKSYVRKAEAQARIAMLFKVKNPFQKQKSRTANLPANKDRQPTDESVKFSNFEKLAKGFNAVVEYLDKDEEVDFKSLIPGESQEVERIYNATTVLGGFGLGLSRMHSTGSSDKASFAGLMAESNISSKTFDYLQKFTEREIYDFETEAVIIDAMENDELPKVDDWDKIGWSGWPKIKALNPLQNIKAIKEWITSGLMPPDEIRGDVADSLKALASFKKEAEELGLNLDILGSGKKENEGPEQDNELEENNK
jgi:hypothetical protein